MKKGTFDDNSTDVFPFTSSVIKDEDREAVLRILAGQPDGAELAIMLGLVEAPPKPKREKPALFLKQHERKLWCEIHNIARESLPWNENATRCIMCFREKSRKRYYDKKDKPMPDTKRVYARKVNDV